MRNFLLAIASLFPLLLEAQTPELDALYTSVESKLLNNVLDNDTRRVCTAYYEKCLSRELRSTKRYAEILTFLARFKSRENDIDAAIAFGEEAVGLRRSLTDVEELFLVESLNELGVYYSRKGRYDEAIKLLEEAECIFRSKYGCKHEFYGTLLCNLSVFYSIRRWQDDDYRAVDMAEKALKILPQKSAVYVNTLSSLSVYYTRIKNHKKSREACHKAISLGRKIFGTASLIYAGTLRNQSSNLAKSENYEDAVILAEEAKVIFENLQRQKTLDYAHLLYNLGLYKEHLEQYKEMPNLLNAANDIFKAIEGKSSVNSLMCISKLADVYGKMGELGKSAEYKLMAEQLQSSNTDANKFNLTFAHSLSRQGKVSSKQGNFAEAISLENSAREIYERLGRNEDVAASLNMSGIYLSSMGETGKAIENCNQALNMCESTTAAAPSLLAQIYANLSTYHYKESSYNQAAECAQKSVSICELSGDTLSPEFSRILSNLALMRFMQGQVEEAITSATHSVNLHIDIFGEQHYENAPLFYNLAAYHQRAGNDSLSNYFFYKALNLQMNYVRTNFSHFTTTEREVFWSINNEVLHKAFDYALRNPSDVAACEAYNVALFTKGLLLNSEVDFRHLLMASGNSELLDRYTQIAVLRKEINDLYLSGREKSEIKREVDRLTNDMLRIERDLIRNCKEYGDFTQSLSIDYKAVMESLFPGEVAVEFATADLNTGGKVYLAICLKKDWEVPKIIRLFDSTRLNALSFEGENFHQAFSSRQTLSLLYDSSKLGEMIWKPLLDSFGEDVKDVYFSPTGIFHQLGIEYLPYAPGKFIFDRYTLHRLSSTKKLADRKTKKGENVKAAVFGGLHYSLTCADLVNDNQQYLLAQNKAKALRGGEGFNIPDMTAVDSLMSASMQADYLPGTLSEAEYVAEQLMQHNISTNVFIEADGTEASFKSLAGEEINIMHIATHGFFINSAVMEKHNTLFSWLQEDLVGDNSLNASGLLFAGSNVVLKGDTIPESVENGILTAKEISRLDFRNLRLVVLSACQTGVGEIREDGVFGLQRGFKKAGAESLLMSLWSVSDEATDLLMRTFYAEYLSGEKAGTALRIAQQTLREKGFSDPFYWASFILLDSDE